MEVPADLSSKERWQQRYFSLSTAAKQSPLKTETKDPKPKAQSPKPLSPKPRIPEPGTLNSELAL